MRGAVWYHVRRKTATAIFIFRHLERKYLAKKKNLHFAFADLKNAFDLVRSE